MNNIKLGIVVGLLILLTCSNANTYAREIAIISNKDFPANSLTKATIKQIYLGEKRVEGSIKIRPMEHRDRTIKQKFIDKVMGNTVDGYKAYWIKKLFQEGITPPIVKTSSAEIVQTVKQTGGGIGYLWADEVKDNAGVKVLLKIEVGD